jgi:hypothetical protein
MPLEKAVITNTVTRERIPVMFNPEEYTLNKDVNFSQTAVPGLSAPIIQFVHGNMQTLEMELFLDTYEQHRQGSRTLNQAGEDVRNLARQITDLMNIDPTTHAPPVLVFTWSSLSFTCVLARASQRFVLFKEDGTPVPLTSTATSRWRPRRSSGRPAITPDSTSSLRGRPSARLPPGLTVIQPYGGRLRFATTLSLHATCRQARG